MDDKYFHSLRRCKKMYKILGLLFCLFFSPLASPLKVDSKNGTVSGRIVGGTAARAGQFPFVAAIYITTPTGTYFCSGSLVNNNWILTAGQCVDGATLFTIYLGTNSLQELNGPNTLQLATEHYVLHPDYNSATLENDVGLIQFRSYITFTDYIQAAQLFPDSEIPESAIVFTMGWGQTSDDSAGPVPDLNYLYLTTISNEECRITYGSQITDGMVCVNGNYNQGTCLGDSGGPLIQYSFTGRVYHVGISSFYSGNGCESTDPSGFTRTHQYAEWIRSIIWT